MNILILGASGLVGRTMLRVLEEQSFPVERLTLAGSSRSAGQEALFRDVPHTIAEVRPDMFDSCDLALFSAGGGVSRTWAPIAADRGCVVVDNSSAWRMHSLCPLVVPEVNSEDLEHHKGIIANPNCSTIQMVVPMEAIRRSFGLREMVISTYQTPSGAGQKGINHLLQEIAGGVPSERISSHRVAYNTVFHSIGLEGESEEETKMRQETRKIMHLPDVSLSVNCVRVPTLGGHGVAVRFTTDHDPEPEEIRSILSESPGVVVVDNPNSELYPTPQMVDGKDEVFVGRIRRAPELERTYWIWICADNVRKGAATNAVQVAQQMLDRKLFTSWQVPSYGWSEGAAS